MGIHDLRDTRVNSGTSCFATFHLGSGQNRCVLLLWVGSMSVFSVFKNGAVAILACLGTQTLVRTCTGSKGEKSKEQLNLEMNDFILLPWFSNDFSRRTLLAIRRLYGDLMCEISCILLA